MTQTKKERFDFLAQPWLSQDIHTYADKHGLTDGNGNFNKTEAVHAYIENLKKNAELTVKVLRDMDTVRKNPPAICAVITQASCQICKFKGTAECPKK